MGCLVFNCLFGGAGIALIILGIGLLLLRQKPSLIFDIYPRKNLFYHLKYGIALVVVKYLRSKLYTSKEDEQNSEEYLKQLDRPQELSCHPKSYDVVSFMAANEKGEKFLVTLERRKRGVLKAALFLWLPEHGILCTPKLPDMVYFTTDGFEENPEFKGCGFHIYPEETMRIWNIRYDGELRRVKDEKVVQVKLNLRFESKKKYFNYNKDLSAGVIADSVAREAWNDSFYKMVNNVDKILDKRTHYEQNGTLIGQVLINDNEKFTIGMRGFRDHSFGTERCLSSINRYVYFALFLEDGTNMVIGNLSQPSFFLSSLKVGYVCTKIGDYKPITQCNFELYSYGEKGVPPKIQNFIVHTDKEKYFVQIKEEDCALRYIGGNWESKVFNQFISCTVNGIKGHGITEFLYHHKGGRPENIGTNDPEWYQKIRNFERSLSNGEYVDDSEAFFF